MSVKACPGEAVKKSRCLPSVHICQADTSRVAAWQRGSVAALLRCCVAALLASLGETRLHVLSLLHQAWHWDAVLAFRVGLQRCRRIERQAFDTRSEFMIVAHELLQSDLLAGVSCHPSHRRHGTGHHTSFDFVVGPVFANGRDQIIPFHLIGILFLWLRVFPLQMILVHVVAFVDAGPGGPV